MDITIWTEDDVHLYFRRLGLSRYGLTEEVHRFGINGKLLLALEMNDLLRFHIPEMILKEIIIDQERVGQTTTLRNNAESLRRRKRLRLHFHFIDSAIAIQKCVRGYLYASKMDALLKLVQRYSQQITEEKIQCWWSDRPLNYMVVSDGCKKRKTVLLEGSGTLYS